MTSPTPGSTEAVAEGCICARMDNSYGAGYRHYDDGRPPVFAITEGCPLHGTVSAMCDCGEALSDDDLRSDARECSNCRNPWERFDNRGEDRLS